MNALSPGPQRRVRQASVGLVIAGLHCAGVLVWWTAGPALQWIHTQARLPTIAVWLPPPTAVSTKPAAPANPRPPTPHLQPTANGTTPARTVNASAAPVSDAGVAPTEARGTVEAQAPSPGSLNLTLSRKDIASVAPRSFAEQSPFHGRLPKTVERQIAAAAAETGPWAEERVDHDHIRFRRGNTCVMMERPRATSIDPFSEAASRLPWRASVADCGD